MNRLSGVLPEYFVLIISLFILLSAPVRILITRYNIPITHNFLVMVTACILGAIMSHIPHLHEFDKLLEYGFNSAMRCYKAVFIFFIIYKIDFFVFKKCATEVLILSFAGILSKMSILALTNFAIVHQEWSVKIAIMAALAYVPIEPSAIINISNDIYKNKLICTMIESEAVLSLVPLAMIFNIMFGYGDRVVTEWYQYGTLIIRNVGGGALHGFIYGKIITYAMCIQYEETFSSVGVCFILVLSSYASAHYLFNVSATLNEVIIAIMVAMQKHKISSSVDTSLTNFFGFLTYILNIIILSAYSSYVVMSLTSNDKALSLYYAVLIYFSANITRFFVFITVGWCLTKIFRYIGTKELIILAFSGIGGSLNILNVLTLVTQIKTKDETYCLLLEMLSFCLLSTSLNCTTIKLMMRVIDIVDLSKAYLSNLKNCLKFITDRRNNMIPMLKLNRYLSNANWVVVRNETSLKHKLHITDDDEEEDDGVKRSTNTGKCPECLKEIPIFLSEHEMNTLIYEAKIKVIKAKKISIIKQYESGIVNKHVYSVLTDIFESILENISRNELFYIKKYFYKYPKIEQNILKMKEKIIEPSSDHLCRRICFYIMMHESYDYIILFALLIQFTLCIWDIIINASQWIFYCVITTFFFVDCIIKVLGHSIGVLGLKRYTLDRLNAVDVWMLIIQIVGVLESVFIKELYRQLAIVFLCTTSIKLTRLLISLLPLWKRLLTSEKKIKNRVNFGYEITTAILNCYEDLLDLLPEIIEVKKIRDMLLVDIKKINSALLREADLIQMYYPSIAITVKTKQVIRSTLKSMENTVRELKRTGYVDAMETLEILNILQHKQKALQNMKFIQTSPPEVIFNEVPWMAGNDKIIEFLYNKVKTVSWSAGEVVCQEGKFSKGIYIIVTGLLKQKYTPKSDLAKKAELGQIPIVDYISTLDFDTNIEDTITSGNSIGELSLLTGRPYDSTIVSESPCQTYLLTFSTIAEAMKMNSNRIDGLEARMWNFAVFNLGVAVLIKAPLYRTITHEQIKLKIHRSFVPDISSYKIFTVTDGMENIILVEGIAANYEDGTIFTAPHLIPRYVQRLYLPSSSFFSFDEIVETKFIVIPNLNLQPDVVTEEGNSTELKMMASSKCLLHLVRDRHSHRDRHSRKKGSKMNRNTMSGTDEKSISTSTGSTLTSEEKDSAKYNIEDSQSQV